MGILLNLSSIALREVVRGAVGLGSAGDAVVGLLTQHFTDHSQKLTKALENANDRAWKAFEVALGGESLWDRCKHALASAEDQAFREQVRAFLDISPLTKASAEHGPLFRQALEELRAARSRGELKAGIFAPSELAREAGVFARFNDPQALLDAEWRLVDQAAGALRERCPNLWKLLVARPKAANRPSLLAVAVRYYFRREVESDQALFQGLAFAQWEAMQEAQKKKGFVALTDALSQRGQRLEGMLSDIARKIDDIDKNTKETLERVRGLEQQLQKLLEQLQLQGRELRPGDSMSVRSEGEQQRVRQLVRDYRALPEEQRRQRPDLLISMGVLKAAAGDLEEAQKDFEEAGRTLSDPKARAEAYHNAYRAALERQQWEDAHAALRQAVALDSGRFAPFPFNRYEPQSILGAGGFGVVFLCQDRYLSTPVVVKALLPSELDRAITAVFAEARALEAVNDPAIVRLRHCDFADAAETRPYLVMEYFEGVNLADYVASHGRLAPEELLGIACPVAEGLQAAHAKGILHRDVKPGNVLVRREGSGWKVKLIDFGLALRPETLQGKGSTTGPQARTTTGRSIAGTLHYAAPEQMGQLPGVPVRAYSDVYGFAKTCCYALFQTPQPRMQHWQQCPPELAALLDACLDETPANRPQNFAAVLAWLKRLAGGGGGEDGGQSVESGDRTDTGQDVKRSRREESLSVLARHGIIQEGSEIELIPEARPEDADQQDQKLFRAQIHGSSRRKSVMWLYDNNIYSLTNLTFKLEAEHGVRWVDGKTMGNWRRVGQTQTLWEEAAHLRGQEGMSPPPLDEELREFANSIGMRFALIPPGKFLMGSPDSEEDRSDDEGPQHELEITRPFYLGIHPVTLEQYEKVMWLSYTTIPIWSLPQLRPEQYEEVISKIPSYFTRKNGGGANHPVAVSWEEAVEFCRTLSARPEEKEAGRTYRLPTETEWEYACRGGDNSSTPFSFGESLSSTQANFNGNSPYGGAAKGPYLQRTTPVGSYTANAFGLFDMHGNVWEWCQDWYDENYYDQSPRQDPQGPPNGSCRVLRGGGCFDDGRDCRSAVRDGGEPEYRGTHVGFRIVCIAPRTL